MIQQEQKTVQRLYEHICKEEKLNPVRIEFKNVGKGGAKCTFVGNKPRSISIDLNRICVGAAYALCHEVAHQIEIQVNGNATHNAAFKSTCNRLTKKYSNCKIASELLF